MEGVQTINYKYVCFLRLVHICLGMLSYTVHVKYSLIKHDVSGTILRSLVKEYLQEVEITEEPFSTGNDLPDTVSSFIL